MKKILNILLITVYSLFQVGCASIISGRYQDVQIQSNPTAANVMVDNIPMGSTPVIAKLKRKDKHEIKITKEGYVEESRLTKKGYNWWDVGNILLGGIIGIIVDFATGAIYEVEPDEIHASLTPKQ